MGNEAIEFHDSTLEAISWVGADALLTMNVYVHGGPGQGRRVGWYQDAVITIIQAGISASPEGGVLEVYDGSVRIGEERFLNLLPLPCDVDVAVEFVLAGTQGSLAIKGSGMRVVLIGERGEIEELGP